MTEPRPAGFVSRTAATLIDAVLMTVLLSVGLSTLSLALELLYESFRARELSIPPVIAALVVPAVFILYQATFWSMVGRTPGKAVMGLHVRTLDGQRLSFPRSLLRVLCYGISMILFLGFLWVLIDDRRMAWHDLIARTWVTYDPAPSKAAEPG